MPVVVVFVVVVDQVSGTNQETKADQERSPRSNDRLTGPEAGTKRWDQLTFPCVSMTRKLPPSPSDEEFWVLSSNSTFVPSPRAL